MKNQIKSVLVILVIFVLCTSETPINQNPIYGKWKIVNGQHNGTSAPQIMMDRFQIFNADHTFKSVINLDNVKQTTGNEGIFYLINDTTLVTYHKDQSGKLSDIANTYFFRIKNDKMHLHGFFLSQMPNNSSILAKVLIDENWTKVNK